MGVVRRILAASVEQTLAVTPYNDPMASIEQSSEQARQEQAARLLVDTIPTLAWSARSDGSADFFN